MRIKYIDGLKGVSAVIVMLTHFVLCFNNLSYLQYVPILGMLFDGGMAVFIFVILSAFSVCCSLDKVDVEKSIVMMGIKRYFRLTLPLIIPSVLACLVVLIGFNYSVQVGESTDNIWTENLLPKYFEMKQLTSGILVGVLKGSALINPLWMMKFIFWGTFLVVPFLYTTRRMKKVSFKIGYLVFFSIVFYSVSPYYSAVVIGVLLYVLHNIRNNYSWLISISALLGVLVLNIYDVDSTKFARGALLTLCIEHGKFLQKYLSHKIFLKLNDFSYEIFLVHATVLASVCCFLFILTHNLFVCLGTFILVTILLAFYLTKIDNLFSRKMDKIYKKVFG